MGDYLKLFEKHSEYETYSSGDMLKPNVSYCEDNNEVHYNPWVDPKLVCKYNVTSISSPTQLRTNYEPNIFKSMEIDGVQLDNLVTEYTFGSTGVHTVKYELYDETKLGNNAPAFDSITSLISVSIPDSVTSIGSYAFSGCTSLTSITIPSSVTSIGSGTFAGCHSLVTIAVDSNNSTYDSRNNCNAIIETATNTLIAGCNNTVIPNSVTSIGYYAFQGCTLKSVTIPNSVTSIGYYAFQGCTSLTSVTIGTGVTSIGGSAFNRCISLTSITIPDSVTSIGSYAFSSCSNLTSITVEATTAPTIQSETFRDIKTNGTLTVPSGSSGYDVWMGTGNYYLGKYNWTKVER